MTSQKSKSAARQERRGKRPRNHEPLMMLAAQEQDIRKISTRARQEPVRALNDAQRRYDAAMKSSDIVFGIGPAGTGKTWMAVMRAAEAMKAGVIDKIVLTRPAVEAGESLGFLPGELEEKYEPYIRPVRDALEEAFGSSHLEYMLKTGKIEARPLAYLRGSTLKNCWVIADEMQNATVPQFKMLLSRIGEGAKFLVNGDPDQTDLLSGSGLMDAVRRLEPIPEIEIVTFGRGDIVRSGLCRKIVDAYSSTPTISRYNAVNDDQLDDQEGLHRYLDERRTA